MPKTKKTAQHRPRTVSPKTVRIPVSMLKKIMDAGGPLADWAEDILEREGLYSDEFLASLARAQADVRAGRVYKVESLDDLLK